MRISVGLVKSTDENLVVGRVKNATPTVGVAQQRALFAGMSTWRRDRVGQYKLRRRLRDEPSGTVYRAKDAQSGTSVTVMELAEELVADTRFLERFRSETAILLRLDHPSVGRVLDFLEIEGRVYVVSEPVVGRTLREVLGSSPLRPSQALALLRGTLVGLDAAHSVRLLHRGLRPESAVLQADGVVKLTGFGQPAYGAGAGARSPLTSSVGISPYAYVAPEQVVGAEIDVRTDVYLAGVLGYELLAGQPPFTSRDPAEVWSMHMAQDPPQLVGLRPELTAPVVDIVRRALAKTPDARQQSAREFIGQIDAVDSPLRVWTESAVVSQLGRGVGPLVVDSLAAVENPRLGAASGGGKLGWRSLRALVPGVAALALTLISAADGYNPGLLNARGGAVAGQHSATTQGPKPGPHVRGLQGPSTPPGVVQTPPGAQVPQPTAVLSAALVALPAGPVSPLLLSVVEPAPPPPLAPPPTTAPPSPAAAPPAPSPAPSPDPSPDPSPTPSPSDDESDSLPADTACPDTDDVADAGTPSSIVDDACDVPPPAGEEGHGH